MQEISYTSFELSISHQDLIIVKANIYQVLMVL